MDPVIGTLLGVVLGTVMTGALAFLNNWYTLKRNREQRDQEEKAAELKWQRERAIKVEEEQQQRLQEIYTQALFTAEHGGYESIKWHGLLAIYYYDKQDPNYSGFLSRAKDGHLRADEIVKLAIADPRLGIAQKNEVSTQKPTN